MENVKIRHTFSTIEKSLPLFIESIGFNPQEEDFARPEGYPYYHWLQTLEGTGSFSFSGEEYILTPGKGIFLTPFTPHSYRTTGTKWSTLYVTFGGSSVDSILNSLELNFSALYTESDDVPFSSLLLDMLKKVEKDSEFTKLELSRDLYSFIIMLKQYGKLKMQRSLSDSFDKIKPVVEWLEEHYSENIGLAEMADIMKMSSQYLTTIFRGTFGISPYSFLIQLRIREAKKKLLADHSIPLKEIAEQVGFNDVSHFVATFRKIEGITPKKYRNLFNKKLQ
ncbi:AraC family transcriptional regulator [Radiobacillus deserti]|uniref:Helix-turn-helix domain-containing protein n=1 Tax=Radiobacillus deserti TaxID=2594883 RepID=A0A516KKL2_9BACI|nr:AraC family transcriptional regulator [Radiobacillus deserti]QDP41925.1 helix-turn-helix domain-containing protein [Radiobacillus deserti]